MYCFCLGSLLKEFLSSMFFKTQKKAWKDNQLVHATMNQRNFAKYISERFKSSLFLSALDRQKKLPSNFIELMLEQFYKVALQNAYNIWIYLSITHSKLFSKMLDEIYLEYYWKLPDKKKQFKSHTNKHLFPPKYMLPKTLSHHIIIWIVQVFIHLLENCEVLKNYAKNTCFFFLALL